MNIFGTAIPPSSTDTAFIYCLSDPRDGQVRYVGKTFNLQRRLVDHLNEKRTAHKNNWISALKRLGLKPVIEALEEFTNAKDEEWQEAERFWIEYLRTLGCPLTNLDGGGLQGKRLSLDTRERIRRAKLNQSPETRAKISASKTGVKRPEEFRRRMSEVAKNRSPETQAKIVKALTGKKRSLESRLRQSETWRLNPMSAEAREAISARQRGIKHSPEWVAKGAQSRTGLRRTPEQRERMRLAAIKRTSDPAWRAAQSEKMKGRKLLPESIAKRTATLKRNIAARKYGQQLGLLV